jgi:hypothetical protein
MNIFQYGKFVNKAQKGSMAAPLQAIMQQHGISQHNSSGAHKRCVAIINPAGANGQLRKKWKQISPYMHMQLSKHGIDLMEWLTTGPGSAVGLASQAAAARVDVLLAVGGDGTIHEVSVVRQVHSGHGSFCVILEEAHTPWRCCTQALLYGQAGLSAVSAAGPARYFCHSSMCL